MTDTPSEWAKEQAAELMNAEPFNHTISPLAPWRAAFARHLDTVSNRLKEACARGETHGIWREQFADLIAPEDELLVEAERMLTEWEGEVGKFAIVCLRRGVELGKQMKGEGR